MAFSFGGKHSIDDFGIVRISDGADGFAHGLAPQMQDTTMEVPGGDGQYFLGTQHKSKTFNINFAFDSLTEEKLNELRVWLDGKDILPLWFEEAPYKVYSAKVTGTPQIKAHVFEESGVRVYKGTGSVTFTCYYPYARTPDFVKQGEITINGQTPGAYHSFRNKQEFLELKTAQDGSSFYSVPTGQLPSSFVAKLSQVGYHTITFHANTSELQDPVSITVRHGHYVFLSRESVVVRASNSPSAEIIEEKPFNFVPNHANSVINGWCKKNNLSALSIDYRYYASFSAESSMDLYVVWTYSTTVYFYKALKDDTTKKYYKFIDYKIGQNINSLNEDNYLNHTGI